MNLEEKIAHIKYGCKVIIITSCLCFNIPNILAACYMKWIVSDTYETWKKTKTSLFIIYIFITMIEVILLLAS